MIARPRRASCQRIVHLTSCAEINLSCTELMAVTVVSVLRKIPRHRDIDRRLRGSIREQSRRRNHAD
jgi:hypothetical protein